MVELAGLIQRLLSVTYRLDHVTALSQTGQQVMTQQGFIFHNQ
jgi:hypothetical protein